MRSHNRWLQGEPAEAPDRGDTKFSPVSIGTSLTNVFTINSNTIGPGVYRWNATLYVVHTGSTGFTVTPGFTGTATVGNYAIKRFTASAVAVSFHTAFQASASSVWILGEISGYFQVTVAGSFTIGCTRVGGTNAVVQIGSQLELYQIL